MVNLEWYRTFKAIYEKGTLTAAAESLFISQPGVSLHLSSLENYVGSKLFDRVTKKMIPTERGKALYNALSDPMDKLMEIEEYFQRSTEKSTPTISVGMCFETFQLILEKYLHKLDFNVIAKFSDFKELLQNLERGIADIVLTPLKSDIKSIEYVPFAAETIVLISSKDIDPKEFHEKLALGQKPLKEWLQNHKWYGRSNDNEHFKMFWQNNFGCNPGFRQNYIVPNFNSILRSLSMGTGLAIIPSFLCKDFLANNSVQILWKGHTPIVYPLYFAYRKKSIYKDQIDQVLAIFKKELSENRFAQEN